MPTEGLSEENRALIWRVAGPRERFAHALLNKVGHGWLNRLLDAARAEGPAPPGGGGEEDYRGSLRSAPGSTSHRTDGAGEGSKAAADVLAERRRQVEAEGWSPEHDDKRHADGALARAAASYATGAAADALLKLAVDGNRSRTIVGLRGTAANLWPWNPPAKRKDTRRDLVRAAALIVAEIERLDRALTKGADRG